MKAHALAVRLEKALSVWHLVRAVSLAYFKVMLWYFGSFWGGRGEIQPWSSLGFPFFLVYDGLGLGAGALIEVC